MKIYYFLFIYFFFFVFCISDKKCDNKIDNLWAALSIFMKYFHRISTYTVKRRIIVKEDILGQYFLTYYSYFVSFELNVIQ